jgi:hypothetical protein
MDCFVASLLAMTEAVTCFNFKIIRLWMTVQFLPCPLHRIDVGDRLGEGLRRFLRQIVSDASGDKAMLVFA